METKSPLTVRDVCEIIRVCNQSGVRRLSFGELRVSFAPGVSTWPTPEDELPPNNAPLVTTAEKIDAETREMDNLRARDVQMAELAITDPVQYEELMERGELADEDGTAED